jgi:alpha-tubulin suppressor-like RCC1 family protein
VCAVSSVGVGKRHTCVLRNNGSVACWGSNDENQLSANVGATLSLTPVEVTLPAPALQLAVGLHHTCAVLTDHSVACWGDNGQSELGDGTATQRLGAVITLPAGSANAVVAGAQSSCALAADGTVWCWGGTLAPASPTKVSGVTGAVQLIAGHRFACTRDAAGGVTCWGANSSGQLGRGTTDTSIDPPGPVAGLGDATDLVGGSRSACAQRAGGSFVCWGNNDSGDLGIGNFTTNMPSPTLVSVPGAVQFAAGTRRMCARLDTGEVECWGSNSHGELGVGDFITRSGPSSPVIGLSGAVDVVASTRHACARVADGSVYCWGENDYGQLGTGTRAASAAPVAAMVPTGATALTSLVERTCAVYPSGDVYCWADVNLGNGTDGWAGLPVKATLTASAVAAGNGHSCAIDSSGAVECWGYNSFGQLGDTTTNNHYTPATATLGSPATRIATGFDHSCAIVAGKAWCWGSNASGQIGDGTATDRSTPVQPSGQGSTTTTGIGGGFAFTCMVLSTGAVECWGDNAFGQLGDNTTTAHATPAAVSGLANTTAIATGWYHACAIDGGALKCWGNNASGQVGDGTYTDRHAPFTVSLPAAPMVVSLGAYHTCAVLVDHTVWCWGANDLAELGSSTVAGSTTPLQVPGVLATTVTASSSHTCVITTAGVTQCWGGTGEGGLGDGSVLAEAMAQRAVVACP